MRTRKDDGNIRSLTIVVQPNQTIEALSSQYVGHFDYQVLQEIRALNPGLADPGHLEPGKALKLPLPREVGNEVRKKVGATAETRSDSKKHIDAGTILLADGMAL